MVHVFGRKLSHDRRTFKARQTMVLLLCTGFLSLFVHQALQHRYGIETRARLLGRSVALGQELDRLEATRANLERETARLATDPPDLDLLDEHARRVLGFLRPDERRIQDGVR